MNVWGNDALGCERWEMITDTAPFSLGGEPRPSRHQGHKVQMLHLLSGRVTASLWVKERKIMWSSDYYGSPLPFNVSFQACDIWLFVCSLIASNNERVVLPGGRHDSQQEWLSWHVLLMNGNLRGGGNMPGIKCWSRLVFTFTPFTTDQVNCNILLFLLLLGL